MTITIARPGGSDAFGAAPPVATSASLRDRLRLATSAAHTRLDAVMGAVDLADVGGFARFLGVHAIALRTVQPAAAAFLADHLGAELPDASAMIAADLAEIGGSPVAAGLPWVAMPAEGGAGVAYVLLGSRMGMAALARRETWPGRHGRAGRYLSDGRIGALWPPLRAWLRNQPAEGAAAAAALTGAQNAFAIFSAAARAMGLADPASAPVSGSAERRDQP